MNEPVECHICSRPGRLLLEQRVMQHDEGGVVRQCPLPPPDVAHPDKLRLRGGQRYAYSWAVAS